MQQLQKITDSDHHETMFPADCAYTLTMTALKAHGRVEYREFREKEIVRLSGKRVFVGRSVFQPDSAIILSVFSRSRMGRERLVVRFRWCVPIEQAVKVINDELARQWLAFETSKFTLDGPEYQEAVKEM